MSEAITLEDKIARFEQIYTGAITDILDEQGYRNCVLPHDLYPLVPGQRVTGTALPMYGEPTTETDPDVIYPPLLRMLGDVQPGQVLVSKANDNVAAHLGELSSETAKYRGARGAVIYGGVRDTDYIIKLGFPVFSRYTTPSDVLGRWRLVDYNCEIEIGGVTIRPGDIIVGDRDGVLVVPHEISDDVLQEAEEVVNTENLVRKDILQGVHPLDAYEKYQRF
ncbi:MAG: RraA family protein [Chloroflexota bacterium]